MGSSRFNLKVLKVHDVGALKPSILEDQTITFVRTTNTKKQQRYELGGFREVQSMAFLERTMIIHNIINPIPAGRTGFSS